MSLIFFICCPISLGQYPSNILRQIFERFFQTIVPIHNVIHNLLDYFIHLLVIESNCLRKV